MRLRVLTLHILPDVYSPDSSISASAIPVSHALLCSFLLLSRCRLSKHWSLCPTLLFIQSGRVSGDRGQEAGPPSAHRASPQSGHLGGSPATPVRSHPAPRRRFRVLHSRKCHLGTVYSDSRSVSSRLSFTRHTAWRCARVSACINGPSPSFLSRTDLASTFGVCLSVTDFYAPTSLPLHLSRSVLWPRIYTVSPGTSLGTCEQRALHACWVEGSLNVH